MEAIKESKHCLVPKHVLLSEEETSKILDIFNVSKSQLPQIKRKDAAIANLNLKPGAVVKIIRRSETANKTNFYRLVIE